MKYSEKQILNYVYTNQSWSVTEGCPCLSAPFEGNEIYVCLFQNDRCEDFMEIEVISTERVEYQFGFGFENTSEYVKEYCKDEEHFETLRELYQKYHIYKLSA